MENTPNNTPILKTERRYCSNIGLALLIYSVISFILQLAAQTLLLQYAPHLLDNSFVFYAFLLLPTYLIATPLCWFTMRFSRPEKIEKKKMKVSHFFIALLMCLTFMYSGNLIGTMLGSLIDSVFGGNSGIAELLTDSSPLANLIFVVLIAPAVEELIFRKFLVDRFIRYGEKTAIICSGLLFGLFHGNLYQFFYAALLGMFFAYIYAKTGRLRITVLMHMTVNFLGGFIAPIILEFIPNFEETLYEIIEILNSPEPSFEVISSALSEFLPVLPGLLIYSVYNTLFMTAVVAGFVLLLVFRRRFKFSEGVQNLGPATFSVTWVNVGVILFSVMCAVLFALNLTA